MAINFQGYVFDDAGNAVNGASVKLLDTGTTTQEGSTYTSGSSGTDGLWLFSAVSEADAPFDVEITKGSSVRRIRWDDQISLKEIDVRNNTGNTTPAATFTNFTNNADNDVAYFRSLRGTGANNDEMFIRYYMDDAGGNAEEVARMTVKLNDATAGSGDAQVTWGVLSGNSIVDALTISSSSSASLAIDFNQDSITFGSGTAATDITLTFDAESADGVITWMEDEDYFKFSDDILMNSTERINFYDTAIYIYSSTDGQLDLVADTEIQIAATTIDINGAVAFNGALTGITNITLSGTLSDGNYTFDTSGNVSGLGTIASGNITSTGTVQGTTITATTAFVPDASDGAALGTTSLEFSDLYLADGAVIGLGDDQDVTLTHVVDTGILLSSTDQFQFGDSGTFIHQSSDGVLTIEADTTVDINGAVALNGAITGATNITLSGELDAATLDLSSSADIAGDLVLSGGADGALQFTNPGENSIKIPDNQASALIIEQADNAYITFVTTNGSEAITVAKATTFSAGIANSGTIAAGTWNGTKIATGYIADDAITSALIADDAVVTAAIADDAITSALIADDAVVTAAIADNAITNALMADDAIDSAQIADGAVDLVHMSSESVDEDNLYISNSGSNGQFLSKQSGNNGGLTWATPSSTATAADDIADGDGAVNILTTSGNITIDAQANDADVIIKVDDNGSSVTAVTFDGSDEGNAIFVNDVQLKSDGALLEFGADLDTTLTHTDGTGLTLNSTNKLAFGDTGTFIHQSSDGVLTITSDTTVDINGAVDIDSGAIDGTVIGANSAAAGTFAALVSTTFAPTDDITTAAGKDVNLGDGGNVNITAPLLAGADHTYSGTTAQMLAGGAISAFDLVCIHTTTGEIVEADASASATSRVIGIAPAAISDTATGTVLLHGFIRDDTWNWTTGGVLFLSETAGAMTHTAPTTDGAFVQAVGIALEPDVVFINPSLDVIEHA